MNAICLVIDRLHAGYLGAYGNTWIDTPAIDRLATESFVFDQALIDTPRVDLLCRSYWQGYHALCRRDSIDGPTLPRLLSEAGVSTTLLSDDLAVQQHPLAVDFDERIEIDPPWQPQMAAEGQYEQTHMARCFIQIIDRFQSCRQPFLLWCHLAGLGTAWDAPREFRDRYWEDGDPELSDSAETPDQWLAEHTDPDEVLRFVQAYAGQVSLLDTCVAALWEAIEEHPAADETMLLLTSARGFPLGEHRRMGPCDEATYGEVVHVPLMLRFPDRMGASARSQALVEPADLWATLLDCWRIPGLPSTPSAGSLMPIIREEVATLRDRLVIAGQGTERAIRTPAWHLRMADLPELFVKPDDRYEVNNVATRCREVVECLQDAIVETEQTIQAGQVFDLPPLSDVLVQGLE